MKPNLLDEVSSSPPPSPPRVPIFDLVSACISAQPPHHPPTPPPPPKVSYFVVCFGLCLPIVLFPIFSVPPSEAGLPLGWRFGVRANLWIAIYSFIGNYW